ncbi:MAG: hypothetical protein ACLQU1_09365 [Bryobacteraceae bacterium]
MRSAGTTILLAIPESNLFFTEHVTRHLQRNTDDTVGILLITNDDTSVAVRDLVRLLAEHPRTRVHHAEGCRDRPIGHSIDSALRSGAELRERLLFTHIDLFYVEPDFWRCDALDNGARMVSGRFVQEPLWLDGESEPIPRPADDHILIDTEFYRKHELVFRAFARARDAFACAPWLPDALSRFRRANGEAIGCDYSLDPFNLSHLKLAIECGPRCGRLWSYHFPKQVHFNSILRASHFGVKRVSHNGVEWLIVPVSARKKNAGYQWRTLIRYAIVSSDFFNPAADYVVPFRAVWCEDPEEAERELLRLKSDLTFLRELAGPLPYRVVGRRDSRKVQIGWRDDD